MWVTPLCLQQGGEESPDLGGPDLGDLESEEKLGVAREAIDRTEEREAERCPGDFSLTGMRPVNGVDSEGNPSRTKGGS